MADDLQVWFPLYVKDILTSRMIRKFEAEEFGIFMFLLIEQWSGGPLPIDHVDLEEIGRAPWVKVEVILQRGFVKTNRGWINERLVEIWVEQDAKRKMKRRAGKAGAEARWGKKPKLIAAPEAPVDTKEDGNRIPPANSSENATTMRPQCDRECDTNGNESKAEQSKAEQSIKRHAPELDTILIRNGLNWNGNQHPPKRGYQRIERIDFEDVMYVTNDPRSFPENLVIETQDELNAFLES